MENIMKIAFDLVCPAKHAQALVQAGKLRAEDAVRVTWRDEIAMLLPASMLESAGVTIAQVRDAIAFYTATEATVEACMLGSDGLGNRLEIPMPGFFVYAQGYRKGPAGP